MRHGDPVSADFLRHLRFGRGYVEGTGRAYATWASLYLFRCGTPPAADATTTSETASSAPAQALEEVLDIGDQKVWRLRRGKMAGPVEDVPGDEVLVVAMDEPADRLGVLAELR